MKPVKPKPWYEDFWERHSKDYAQHHLQKPKLVGAARTSRIQSVYKKDIENYPNIKAYHLRVIYEKFPLNALYIPIHNSVLGFSPSHIKRGSIEDLSNEYESARTFVAGIRDRCTFVGDVISELGLEKDLVNRILDNRRKAGHEICVKKDYSQGDTITLVRILSGELIKWDFFEWIFDR